MVSTGSCAGRCCCPDPAGTVTGGNQKSHGCGSSGVSGGPGYLGSRMSPAPRVPQAGSAPGSSGRGSMEHRRGQDHGKAPSTWFRIRRRGCGCGQGTGDGAGEAAGTGEAAGDTRGCQPGRQAGRQPALTPAEPHPSRTAPARPDHKPSGWPGPEGKPGAAPAPRPSARSGPGQSVAGAPGSSLPQICPPGLTAPAGQAAVACRGPSRDHDSRDPGHRDDRSPATGPDSLRDRAHRDDRRQLSRREQPMLPAPHRNPLSSVLVTAGLTSEMCQSGLTQTWPDGLPARAISGIACRSRTVHRWCLSR